MHYHWTGFGCSNARLVGQSHVERLHVHLGAVLRPMATSLADPGIACLPLCSSITSSLLFIIFSTGWWSLPDDRLDLLPFFTVSNDRDLPASEDLCFAPFSLLRRDELRWTLDEFLLKLGRFTDSALALSPVAIIFKFQIFKSNLIKFDYFFFNFATYQYYQMKTDLNLAKCVSSEDRYQFLWDVLQRVSKTIRI